MSKMVSISSLLADPSKEAKQAQNDTKAPEKVPENLQSESPASEKSNNVPKMSLMSVINAEQSRNSSPQPTIPLHLKPISFADILNQSGASVPSPKRPEEAAVNSEVSLIPPQSISADQNAPDKKVAEEKTATLVKPKARKKPAKESEKPKKKRKTKAQKEKEQEESKEVIVVDSKSDNGKKKAAVKTENQTSQTVSTSPPPANPFTTIEKPEHIDNSKKKPREASIVTGNSPKKSNLSKLLNSDDDKIIEVLDDDEEEEDEDGDGDVELDVDDDDGYVDNSVNEEIPLVFEVPLNKIDNSGKNNMEDGQVIINIMKMAEEKYGFNSLHPNAKFALDGIKDDLFDDDIDVQAQIPENNELLKEHKKNQLRVQKEQQQKLKEQLQLQDQAQEGDVETEKKIKEMITKNNRKLGKYDYEDPFIDDTELYWEETRAVTEDGFFVYYGPLVDDTQQKVLAAKSKKGVKKARSKVKK